MNLKTHSNRMACDLAREYALDGNIFHIDINTGDTTLLRAFEDLYGHLGLSVDTMYEDSAILRVYRMKADLITAINQSPRQSHVSSLIMDIKVMLKRNGLAIVEFPRPDIMYLKVATVKEICEDNKLVLLNVSKHEYDNKKVLRCQIANSGLQRQAVLKAINEEV